MAGPWEDYQPAAQEEGPWAAYGGKSSDNDPARQIEPKVSPSAYKGGFEPYSFTDELMHGATMGLTRPLYAAGQTLGRPILNSLRGQAGGISDAYLQGEREYDAARSDYAARNPYAALGAGFLGGASTLGGSVANTAGWLGRLGQGAKLGATYGGVQGLAEGSGSLADRALSGATGAAVGGTIGAAIPATIDAARTVTAPVRAMVSAARNPEAAAARQVAQAMADDGVTIPAARQALAQAQRDGVRDMTLTDVAGPNAERLTAVYAKTPGPGKTQAIDFYNTRAANRGDNIVDVARPGLGNPEQTYSEIDRLLQTQKRAAQPLYEKAYNTPLDTASPAYRNIEEVLNTPTGQSALAAARTKMLDERIPSKHILIQVADDGSVTLSRQPDTRTLDYVKRAIDDKIQAARRGGNNDDARIYQGIKNEIVGSLDSMNPAYRAARAAFRGPAESMDAIELGQNFLNMRPEEIRRAMADLSRADKDFARLGAARSLRDVAGQPTDQTLKLISGNMRDRFREIFPDQSSYERAVRAFETIRKQNNVGRTVRGGSSTYENFAQAGDARLDPSVIQNAATGNVWGLTADAIRGLSNRFGGLTPGVARSGIGMMAEANPAQQMQILRMLENARRQQFLSRGNLSALQNGLIGGISGTMSLIPLTRNP